MSAVGELTNVLKLVRNKLAQPPEAFRFHESYGPGCTIVNPNQRLMFKTGVTPEERDLRTAFNKRAIRAIFPAADGIGDLCYNESTMSFYVWTGTDWYCFGYRG